MHKTKVGKNYSKNPYTLRTYMPGIAACSYNYSNHNTEARVAWATEQDPASKRKKLCRWLVCLIWMAEQMLSSSLHSQYMSLLKLDTQRRASVQ